MKSKTSVANIAPMRFKWPNFKKIWVTAWNKWEPYRHSSGTTTFANIVADDEFTSTFNTAVTSLAAQHTQDNTTMSKLSETNQSM